MPRLTTIYTRKGDEGETSLGGGQRVPKDSARVAAYGTVDELNSVLGVALAVGVNETIEGPLHTIQNELFHLGSDLCILEEDKARRPAPKIEARHVEALEDLILAASADAFEQVQRAKSDAVGSALGSLGLA